MMNVRLLIPDWVLPSDAAVGVELPALKKWLARARVESLPAMTLEDGLCEIFGVAEHAIAPVTLQADGLEPGSQYWLRADPVHLHIQHHRLMLRTDATLAPEEAQALCAALNAHFAADGLRFAAPHPQRWYLGMETAPDIATHGLSAVEGGDVQARLPWGTDALRWHRLLDEAQMLLYAHPVNAEREARGELPVNGVWLWGGGTARVLKKPYAALCGDSELARAFAQAAGIPVMTPQQAWSQQGDVLCVWEGLKQAMTNGDPAAWRVSAETLERECIAPLLALLRNGKTNRLTLDVPQSDALKRHTLIRRDLWKFWRGFTSHSSSMNGN